MTPTTAHQPGHPTPRPSDETPIAWNHAHWFGLRLGVPTQWSCAKHSCNPTQGSLVFVDRTRPRLQLTWTATDTPPTLEQLLDDYRRRTLAAIAETTEKQDKNTTPPTAPCTTVGPTEQHAHWSWVTRHDQQQPTLTRLVRFDPHAQRLLELTLVHDTHPPTPNTNTQTRAPQPRQLAEQATLTSDATRWCLLGLDITTPTGWRPHHIDARPADVALHFTQQQQPQTTVIARRQGMTPAWFDGDLDTHLRHEHPDPRAAAATSTHPDFSSTISGNADQPRYQRWIGRRQRIQLLAQHHPQTETLLSLRLEHLARTPVAPDAFRVHATHPPVFPPTDPPTTRASLLSASP